MLFYALQIPFSNKQAVYKPASALLGQGAQPHRRYRNNHDEAKASLQGL
jgi:hypothetical protein